MNAEAREALERDRAAIDERLRAGLAGLHAPERLRDAMEYSLLGGGKRLRALLCLHSSDALGAARTEATWLAAQALEFLHCYSLIHDDLPAMDDDDLRRGQPSCHRRFDEATAILAGDSLHTLAFQWLARIEDAQLARDLTLELSRAAGPEGMAGGQQMDLQVADPAAGDAPEDPALGERLHRLKTGALIGAAMAMGARVAGATPERVDCFREIGIDAGLAFQIVDDVLDQTQSAALLGKSAGKDREQGKLSAVRALGGVEAAQARATALLQQCLRRLDDSVAPEAPLRGLLRRLVERRS